MSKKRRTGDAHEQRSLDPLDQDADSAAEQEERSPQDLTYDRVVRGDAGANLPPGPQDAMTQEVDGEDDEAGQADERAARQAEQDVDRREHSADRHADPSFRRTGG